MQANDFAWRSPSVCSTLHAMAYRVTTFDRFWVSAVSIGFAVGCGAQAQSGTQTQNTGGGSSSSSAMTTLGASSGMGGSLTSPTGGSTAIFGGGTTSTQPPNGGTGSTDPSSTSPSTGGKAATGGKSSTGGTTAVGGKSATGGKSSAGGGKSAAGGKSSAGGATATAGASSAGGKIAVGGANAGGNSAVGGTTSPGGSAAAGGAVNTGGAFAMGGSTSSQGGSSAGNTALAAFCTGSDAKVNYQGQTVKAPATNFTSNLAMDCCNSSGVNLHSRPSLGFDFAVEVIESAGGNITPGSYSISMALQPFRIAVRKSTDTSSYGDGTTGTLEVFTPFAYDKSGKIGFCVEVTDGGSELLGTQLYVPEVTLSAAQDVNRWKLYLLKDSTITPATAATQPLDALTLASNPLLTLRQLAYVGQSSGEFGFTPGQAYGNSLKTDVGQVSVPGLPFVVVADDVRIYLGSFYTSVSSYRPEGPMVTIEDIGTDSFTIAPPAMSGTDPRFDARIVKVLTETGRLIP